LFPQLVSEFSSPLGVLAYNMWYGLQSENVVDFRVMMVSGHSLSAF